MKVAYVAFLPTGSIGVERHIASRAKAAQALGLENFHFIVIGGTPGKHPTNIPNLKYLPYPVSRYSVHYLRSLFRRFDIIKACLDGLDYDRIVLRYPGVDPSAEAFFARFPTFTEHHSDELSEMSAKVDAGFPFAERQVKRIRYSLERRYGAQALGKCAGVIGVTDEIRRIELARTGLRLRSTVIANGVDVARIPRTGFVPFDGSTLNVAFVGSLISPRRTPWHGLDRVLSGLLGYKGGLTINLHIIGQLEHMDFAQYEQANVSFIIHGEKRGSQLDGMLSSMNLALSTLALHRKNMSQACALKTREYYARGLPFALAYDDPDLADGHQHDHFFLRLPSSDEPVPVDALVEFVRRLSNQDAVQISESMRAFAMRKLDWTTKVAALWEFASGVEQKPEPHRYT